MKDYIDFYTVALAVYLFVIATLLFVPIDYIIYVILFIGGYTLCFIIHLVFQIIKASNEAIDEFNKHLNE